MILLKLSRMNFPCIVLNKKETQKIERDHVVLEVIVRDYFFYKMW